MFALTIAFVIPRISAPREERDRERKRERKIASRISKGGKWIAWPIYRSRGEKTDGYRDSRSPQSREGDSTRSNNFQGGSFRRKVRAGTIRSERDRVRCTVDTWSIKSALNRRDGWRLIRGPSADTQRDASGSERVFPLLIAGMSRNSIQCSFTLFHAFLITLVTRVTHILPTRVSQQILLLHKWIRMRARSGCAPLHTLFKFYNYFKYSTVIEPRGIRKFKS